ncbi:MAG TPA: hypothetical protein ENH82_04270 [bacterium]|nr:hypothetical protein [bacterium]
MGKYCYRKELHHSRCLPRVSKGSTRSTQRQMSHITLETINLILGFENKLNEIIFSEGLQGDYDKEQTARDLKGYFSEIKKLVNEEKEIEIKQKL